MATPRGTFELKYFFHRGDSIARGGESGLGGVGALALSRLIATEPPSETLSDDASSSCCAAKASTSRRTIAKYREACGSRPHSAAAGEIDPDADACGYSHEWQVETAA